MGVLPQTLLLAQLNMKETIINNSQNQSIWKQTSMNNQKEEEEDQELAISKAKAKAKSTFNRSIRSRTNNSLMKKRSSRSRSSSSSSSATRIEQRVSTLRNLVPNTNNDDDDNEGSVASIEQLFTQTADYILSLQTTVRLMKTLVDVLSGSSSSSSNDHE